MKQPMKRKPKIADRIVPLGDVPAYMAMQEAIANKDQNGGNWWQRDFYGVHAYRVTHFHKEVALKYPRAEYRSRLVYCNRSEAQWVSASGICGLIREISAVVSFGRVEWTRTRIWEAVLDAKWWVKRMEQNPHGYNYARLYVTNEGRLKSL